MVGMGTPGFCVETVVLGGGDGRRGLSRLRSVLARASGEVLAGTGGDLKTTCGTLDG